uniref:Putative secreted protein n=1 Tax=Anopheles darlingi TaxID=43151 RepID=A0A2M4DLM3_ANODA
MLWRVWCIAIVRKFVDCSNPTFTKRSGLTALASEMQRRLKETYLPLRLYALTDRCPHHVPLSRHGLLAWMRH